MAIGNLELHNALDTGFDEAPDNTGAIHETSVELNEATSQLREALHRVNRARKHTESLVEAKTHLSNYDGSEETEPDAVIGLGELKNAAAMGEMPEPTSLVGSMEFFSNANAPYIVKAGLESISGLIATGLKALVRLIIEAIKAVGNIFKSIHKVMQQRRLDSKKSYDMVSKAVERYAEPEQFEVHFQNKDSSAIIWPQSNAGGEAGSSDIADAINRMAKSIELSIYHLFMPLCGYTNLSISSVNRMLDTHPDVVNPEQYWVAFPNNIYNGTTGVATWDKPAGNVIERMLDLGIGGLRIKTTVPVSLIRNAKPSDVEETRKALRVVTNGFSIKLEINKDDIPKNRVVYGISTKAEAGELHTAISNLASTIDRLDFEREIKGMEKTLTSLMNDKSKLASNAEYGYVPLEILSAVSAVNNNLFNLVQTLPVEATKVINVANVYMRLSSL